MSGKDLEDSVPQLSSPVWKKDWVTGVYTALLLCWWMLFSFISLIYLHFFRSATEGLPVKSEETEARIQKTLFERLRLRSYALLWFRNMIFFSFFLFLPSFETKTTAGK